MGENGGRAGLSLSRPTTHRDPCSRDGTTELPCLELARGVAFYNPPWIGHWQWATSRKHDSRASLNTALPIGYSLEKGGSSCGLLAAPPPPAQQLGNPPAKGVWVKGKGINTVYCRDKGVSGQVMELKAGDRAEGCRQGGCGLMLHCPRVLPHAQSKNQSLKHKLQDPP